MNELAPSALPYLPHAVLGGYLLVLLVIGIIGYRKSRHSEEDYYLAGRNQGWVVSSLTIMATFFSSFAMLGASGMVYRDGVVFALFALNVPVGAAAVYVLGSKIHRLGKARNYVTPGDLLSDYYQSPVAIRLLVASVGFLYAVPYVVMQIQAGGLLSQQLFPGERSFEIGAVVLAIITMVYIMIGGMRSVAWTDVLQGLLLMFGMLIAGLATVSALGGLSSFLKELNNLPPEALTVPGTTGSWSVSKLFTVCLFASVGSMIQPAQWMRYYSADSRKTLRRSALIFAVLLTGCYLFGIMLVGLGGQALYPLRIESTGVLPHPAVGETSRDFDQIVMVVLKEHLPEMLGPFGLALGSLIMVAIMAAAMSTADSNLHSLSAVLTKDVFSRFIKPSASSTVTTWVGRVVICVATILSLVLVIVSRHSEHFNPVGMIAQLGLLAIAFSTQLLPVTIDALSVRRGSRQGAVAGIITGLVIVLCFSPALSLVTEAGTSMFENLKKHLDIGAWGLIGNVTAFALVSAFTAKPERSHQDQFKRILDA